MEDTEKLRIWGPAGMSPRSNQLSNFFLVRDAFLGTQDRLTVNTSKEKQG